MVKALVKTIEEQHSVINRQMDIIEEEVEERKKIKETNDNTIRYTILVSSAVLVIITCVFIACYFLSPHGWDKSITVESKNTNENVNRNNTDNTKECETLCH